jgi:F0F1-type ATP synthase membrane subunit b/b'
VLAEVAEEREAAREQAAAAVAEANRKVEMAVDNAERKVRAEADREPGPSRR